ncbi:hypothetical protein THII_1892 [Thioploca ingrica]|uniref:Uncharacterized protein n=1 Tax=Thioploca ingrica TaxID=40754 RepID=A0A090AGA8_9GAMM|nr:hypothetical protein THII_1892 [Thioploca ingrica]
MNQANPVADTAMTMTRFSQLVAAYGGHTNHWPLEEQVAAAQLLETSAEARHLRQAAVSLDDLLDQVATVPPSLKLRNRILAAIQPPEQPLLDIGQWLSQLLLGTTSHEHIWRPAVILLIPLLLGIVMGLSLASFNDTGEVEEEFNLLGLGTLEQQL